MLARLATPYLRRLHRRALSFGTAPEHTVPESRAGRRYLLYVHVPFCQALCPFCSFHRVTYEPTAARGYFEALRTEIRNYAALGFDFVDVYIGGGTPTVNSEELLKTLATLHEHFELERISVETNPDHLRPELLHALADAGVRRLSVGVQSFDDELLREMRRYDRYGSGAAILERLAETRGIIDTVNVDLMFNYPHQTAERLARDLELLQQAEIEQVSFYPLMAADSVARNMARTMGQLDFGKERAFYYQILDAMAERYTASSVWCFSRHAGGVDTDLVDTDLVDTDLVDTDPVDEYIIDHDEYLGIGSGAFSYLNGTLYATSFSILDYDQQIAATGTGIRRSRALSRREQLRFHLLTTLFGGRLDLGELEASLGPTARRELRFELTALSLLGTLRRRPGAFELTRRGRYHWLVMMREFLNAINNLRDEMRAPVQAELAASYPELIETLSVG